MREKKSSQNMAIKSLFPFIKKYKLSLIVMIFAIIIEVIIGIYFAKAIGGIVDAATAKNFEELKKFLVLFLVLICSDMIIKFIKTYFTGRFTEYCLFDIRQKTLRDISNLPIPYLDTHPSGDLVSRVTSDLVLIQSFLQGTLGDLLGTPLRVIVSGIYLFIISIKLALFTVISIPLLMVLSIILSRPMQKYTKQQQDELGKVNSLAEDCISGLLVIKSFVLQENMKERYNKAVNKSVSKGLKACLTNAFVSPFGMLMSILPFILCFGFGGYLGVHGEITLGMLFAFINLLNFVVSPLSNVPNLIKGLRSASAGAERLNEVWMEAKERTEGTNFNINDKVPVINFDDVYFSYNNEEKNILKDLSLNIKDGETVALVGHSGCGKSTLLNLITGFYSINKGSIKIYNHDISSWKLTDMRNLISTVAQDNYLFPESIYTNISYGNPKASREEIITAAKLANCHDFIMSLPEAYDTLAGERGVKLSGGQKQRIAIARAILKNAPILLLDEATSALDTESEKEVQNALLQLMKNRTTLVVAHRLSTIQKADRILVIDDGRVVEEGTHEELFLKDTLYKQLYLKQFSEKTENKMEELDA
jgi:ABC-type multidrug transport system fused ATPase/permease subunit